MWLKSQHEIGLGIGMEYLDPIKQKYFLNNKDFFLNYSYSRKILIANINEGIRYLDKLKSIRSNTYFLLGVHTPKEKKISFNFLLGGALSFMTNHKYDDYYNYYYYFQLCPTTKVGMDIQLNKKKTFYLSLNIYLSVYQFKSKNKSILTSNNSLTGSSIIGFNYRLKTKP